MCIGSAPAVFELNAAGQSEVVDPAASSEQDIVDAALGCPVGAIAVFDAETGEDLLA
jgi:ferredoxin